MVIQKLCAPTLFPDASRLVRLLAGVLRIRKESRCTVVSLFDGSCMSDVFCVFPVTNTINKVEGVSHQHCNAIKLLCVWSCDGPFLISDVMSSPSSHHGPLISYKHMEETHKSR